jgi:Fe-S oxidoreductase
MSIAKGEGMEETRADYAQALRNLEPDVRAIWPGDSAKTAIPYEAEGADLLYVALSGAHSIVPAAAIMNAAGEKWTLSSFEAVNFGAFVGDSAKMKKIAKRVIDEAIRLKVKEVAIVECGTAFRVIRHMMGEQPFRVLAFVELIDRYISGRRITLDRSRLKGKVTYHDPCQIARNSGVMEEPRRVIRAIADDFVELIPAREENWCCGGGGGLISMGELEFRMKSSKVKADQLRASGADMVTTACENCHSQLSDLNEHYALGMKVEFLSHLVAQALVKPGESYRV